MTRHYPRQLSYVRTTPQRRIAVVMVCIGALGCGLDREPVPQAVVAGAAEVAANPPAEMLPRFAADGALIRPEGWEGWVLAGASMGLTYNEPARVFEAGEPPGNFLSVYVQPWAYERFLRSGEFAEGTMFILAGAEPVRKADPARGGFYQGELVLLEVHLKKEGLHDSGWGFYGFGGGGATAELIAGDAACYSCHSQNAALDNVFVQFYPPLRDAEPSLPADTLGAQS